MVLAAEAPCHAQPTSESGIVRSYRLGDVIDIDSAAARGGATWFATETMYVSGLHPPCWIEGRVTTSYDRAHPETALDTLTAYVLRSATSVRFEDLVAAENLLLGPQAAALRRSALLQYRRLVIVAKANAALDVLRETPLEVAWVLAHRDFLAQDPFAAGSYPLAKPYWELYERFKTAPWADDLAWNAAQLTPPTDECYSDCVLTVGIVDGPMQYWTRLPKGNAIAAALQMAIGAAKQAAQLACFDRKDHPGSQSESPVPPDMVEKIRSSLSAVTMPAKDQLLAVLSDAEAKCR